VYLDACIKETMRLRPALVSLMRKNELPDGRLDLLGFAIPSGAEMAPFIFGVHRDPAYWERPEEFLPERFLPVSAVCHPHVHLSPEQVVVPYPLL
jgi:cytochrome P450